MFTCLHCGRFTSLPTCQHCGSAFEIVDGVYQLTRDPNLNLADGHGSKYIGYDRVGAYYYDKGYAGAACKPADMVLAKKMADLIGGGVLLDLGCGGGTYAVPSALHGCTVVAGDISQVMLELMLRKAAANGVAAGRIIPCRMNALSIPLADASVDGVLASTMLHLISDPARVIAEIRRVLKSGGKLMLTTNSPGANASARAQPAPATETRAAAQGDDAARAGATAQGDAAPQSGAAGQAAAEPQRPGPPSVHARPATPDPRDKDAVNSEYTRRENEFHRRYWHLLNELGVRSTHESWSFDQYAACEAAFGNITHVHIPFKAPITWTLSDAFLYRMGGKGFSRQQGVTEDLHAQVFARVLAEFTEEYGPDFGAIQFVGEYDGLDLRVFEK